MRVMLEELVREVRALREKVVEFDDKLCALATHEMTKKEKNALRRQYYRERKELALKDKLPLPGFGILTRRDKRIEPKFAGWAKVGLSFGALNKPLQFLRWFVWTWNNEVYIKKPITFSGSAFQIWNGHCRHGYGPGDLMHLYRKRIRMVPFFRNEADYQDFKGRPWWVWGEGVLRPVVFAMKEDPAWETFSKEFRSSLEILCGGYAMLKIEKADCFWDFNETKEKINKMMKHISMQWLQVLNACATGLRASECPKLPELK